MKSKAFIIISIAILALAGGAKACGPYYYGNTDLWLYRIQPYSDDLLSCEGDAGFRSANCRLWAKEVGGRVSEQDVQDAVYGFSLKEWGAIARLVVLHDTTPDFWRNRIVTNGFVERLVATADSDAVLLLYFSKWYEMKCREDASLWSYTCCGEIDIENAMLNKVKGKIGKSRYGCRYLLLAEKLVRRMSSWQEGRQLWEREEKHFRGHLLYDKAKGYAAACYQNVGDTSTALRMFSEVGDVGSVMLLCHSSEVALNLTAQYCPNSRYLQGRMQEILNWMSSSNNWYTNREDTLKVDQRARFAQKMANDPRVEEPGMWQYIRAAALSWQGRDKEALSALAGAEKHCKREFMKQSVRMLRTYLLAKTKPVNGAYETWIVGEMKWLQTVAEKEWKQLDTDRQKQMSEMYGYQWQHTLYATTMMEAIVKNCCAERLVSAGREVRALQLVNMADNAFYRICGNSENKLYDSKGNLVDCSNKYCKYTGDYSSYLFLMQDCMKADRIAEYVSRLERPRDAMDRYLNAHSMTGRDYWYEILGTHYLRERNYAKAVETFGKVDGAFEKRMNLTYDYDPFEYRMTKDGVKSGHKLAFAKDMVELQKTMRQAKSADQRALAMIEYSIGMRNSYCNCWALTTYGQSYGVDYAADTVFSVYNKTFVEDLKRDSWDCSGIYYAWEASRDERVKGMRIADSLQAVAFTMFENKECKALACLKVNKLKTLREEYKDTKVAAWLRSQCDGREMYEIRRPPYWI